MARVIQVEIEHRKYVDFCPAERNAQGRLFITTMEAGQRRAHIKLFAGRSGRRTPVQTIDVRGLPAEEGRRIPMQLTGAVISGGKLRVRLYCEGSLFLERIVPVARFLGPSRRALLAALLALLLLAGGLGAWMLSGIFQADASVAPVAETSGAEPDAVAEEMNGPDLPGDAAGDTGAPDDRHDEPSGRAAPIGAPGDNDSPEETEIPASEDFASAPGDEPDEHDDETDEPDAVSPAPGDEPDVPAETDGPVEQDELLEPRVHTVRFRPESARLTDEALGALRSVNERLAGHSLDVRIDGHTAVAGTETGRGRLSRARAEAVRDFLVSEGLESDRISSLRALGDSDPITLDRDEQQLNRRVEIVELEDM